MARPLWGSVAIFMALLASCSSIRTGVRVKEGVGYDGRSYFLQSWPESPYPGNEQARRAIDRAIHRVMQSKGFVVVPQDEATLWLSYTAGKSESHIWAPWKQVRERPAATRVAKRLPANRVVLRVLNIHVAEARSQRIVWEGWGETEIQWEDLTNQLHRVVTKILEPFPPR